MTEVDHEGTFDVDDLISAMASHLRWAHAHPELRDYWADRYQALRTGLGLEPDPFDDDDVSPIDPAVAGVRIVLRAAALGAESPPSPFASFLEAPEPVIDLYRRFGPDLSALHRRHTHLHREIARACLGLLSPGIEDRTCPRTVLRDAGVALSPPDVSDYW